jgi:hypothetical protein
MRRYNHVAMDKSLKLDGSLTTFYIYNRSVDPSYDEDTQLPVSTGEIVETYADAQNVTMREVAVAGGLIDITSKKFTVRGDFNVAINDEVLDEEYVQTHVVVAIDEHANRKILFANVVKNGANEH